MAPPCHREIVYLASFKEQLGSEQIFGKKKKTLDVACMYVCMKSKYTDLDYTKCQMASMLYFLWWEIHFYAVGLVRLAFLDQRSVAKLMVLVDHREFVSVLNLCCEEFCES